MTLYSKYYTSVYIYEYMGKYAYMYTHACMHFHIYTYYGDTLHSFSSPSTYFFSRAVLTGKRGPERGPRAIPNFPNGARGLAEVRDLRTELK